MSDTASAYACGPCRAAKVGCDKSRPHCMRCLRRGLDCCYAPKPASLCRNSGRATSNSSRSLSINTQSRLASHSPRTNSESKSPTSLVQKRNRVPKACLRCRQLKIKCDRQQPCSRCIKANGGRDCHYPRPTTEPDKEFVPLWKQTFHSGIHWSGLVQNIQSLLKHRRWAESQEQADQHVTFSSVDNIFGNIGPLSSAPRRTLLSYIPPRDVAESFIAQYLDSVEPYHQILHVPTFKEELEVFWSKPGTVGDGWLAQLFAILALGCQLHCTPASTNSNKGISPDRLFEGAQACLQRTPFMIRPQLMSIRALCLFVIFKQTKVMMTCVECDALWPATGLIVRLAVLLGLHSTDSAQHPQFESSETTIRNRLWAAVILLDLRQSLAAGMPIIPPSRDLIAEPLFTIHQQTPAPGTDLVFPLVLYDILPQIFRILELATSPQVTLAYSQVASYDRQIRALLKYHESSFLTYEHEHEHEHEQDEQVAVNARFQWTMTNVFFRRVLLALHSRLYQEPDAPTRYPVSYWSSLECSIALLSTQRELWDTSSSPSPSVSDLEAKTAAFLARLFIQDFFLAVVTICFHLVQEQAPLVSGNGLWCQGHARRTILELLRSCRDIWGVERGAPVCHGRSFRMIDGMVRFLESGSGSGLGSGSRGSGSASDDWEDEVGVEVVRCTCAKEGCEVFSLEQWVDGFAGY